MSTTTARDILRLALAELRAAQGQLAAALRDPDASEARIDQALRRAAGHVRVLHSHRRDRVSEEGRHGHE
jgi:hypothetical protein